MGKGGSNQPFSTHQTKLQQRGESGKCLNILHQNIQCIKNKLPEIELFINSLTKVPDVICFSEHWMNKDEIQFLKIPNYRIISGYARENFIHGGTAILIRDNITDFDNVQWITNLSVEKEIEVSCAISNTRKMIILTVYRTCLGDAQIFLRKIEQILYEINMKFNKYDVVLCGDFNINL